MEAPDSIRKLIFELPRKKDIDYITSFVSKDSIIMSAPKSMVILLEVILMGLFIQLISSKKWSMDMKINMKELSNF